MNDLGKCSDGSLALTDSKKIYSKDAILATAYKFTDQVFIDVSDEPEGSFIIHFRNKGNNPLEQVVGEFSNKLIDQQLREKISKDTRELRDVVIKKAFAVVQK